MDLSVAPANSPALLRGRSPVLVVETGGDSLLRAEDGGAFLELQARCEICVGHGKALLKKKRGEGKGIRCFEGIIIWQGRGTHMID